MICSEKLCATDKNREENKMMWNCSERVELPEEKCEEGEMDGESKWLIGVFLNKI